VIGKMLYQLKKRYSRSWRGQFHWFSPFSKNEIRLIKSPVCLVGFQENWQAGDDIQGDHFKAIEY
jgi:hypothetical protein